MEYHKPQIALKTIEYGAGTLLGEPFCREAVTFCTQMMPSTSPLFGGGGARAPEP